MKYDLSILIPARNEEWLSETIADIIKNKRGKTEVIVVLDGELPIKPIADHEDLTLVYLPESIGQRAGQNLACKLSKAKYVAKTDAHCAFDEGFDVKLMEKMEDDITMVPVMRNLHIFNWKCLSCGMEVYQGPQPEFCRNETCVKFDADNVPKEETNQFEKQVVWFPKPNPQSSAYRFNKNLQFKYFPELRAKLPRTGLQETMSLQGSFFMCTRENYWKLNLCDESWGSWGQQGTEVALKTWLSGGRVMCNFDTWYAHLFRTQKGFSFPYPMSGRSQQKAREISQDIFLNDKWPMAKHKLSWLLNKFWFALKDVTDPEARWEEKDLGPTKGAIFYTDNRLNLKIAHAVQKQLNKATKERNIPIVSASLKPMNFGKNIVVDGERGYETYFRQILTALKALDTDIVYFLEHDVLYHPSHFDFTPPRKDTFYYNQNVWRLRYPENFAVTWDANQVAQLVCYRDLAIEWYEKKLAEYQRVGREGFNRKFEPEDKFEIFRQAEPDVDIRHGQNLTKSKWSLDDFRNKATAVNFRSGECPDWAKSLLPVEKV